MKRFTNVAESVAKIFSPLILSFIIIACAYFALKQTVGETLSALSLFLADSQVTAQYPETIGFKPYEGADDQEYIDGNDIDFPKRGELYARLTIDSCGIEDNVYFDDSKETLRLGLGQYYGSRIPGYGEPILIAGHNNRTFRLLENVAVGDIATITTSYGVYQYQVTDIKILQATDPNAVDLMQKKEQLILYTCYPFTTLTLKTQRLFVYADKISGPVVLH